MITTKDLRIVRGQTFAMNLTAKDQTGQRIDMTGATVLMQAKTDIKAPTNVFEVTGVLAPQTGSTKGQVSLTITPAMTLALEHGGYVYDAWLIQGATRFPLVAMSNLTIIPNVTAIP